jgi:hypothetical protein
MLVLTLMEVLETLPHPKNLLLMRNWPRQENGLGEKRGGGRETPLSAPPIHAVDVALPL